MSGFKPVLVTGILAVIGYVVYVTIHDGPLPEPPPDAPTQWAQPDVQLGVPGLDPAPGLSMPSVASKSSSTSAPRFDSPAPLASAAPHNHNHNHNHTHSPVPITVRPEGGSTPPPAAALLPPSEANTPASGQETGSTAAERPAAERSTEMTSSDEPSVDRYFGAAGAASSAPGEPSSPQASTERASFTSALANARALLAQGQLAEAHLELSGWYDEPRLSMAEQQELKQLLDQLAGSVIYSREHSLDPPYEVQPGDRLQDIAQKYQVPWELLAKINGIEDPERLYPGEKIKVIRGPFGAVVSLDKREMALMLEDSASHKIRYAGRFPVDVAPGVAPAEGSYQVRAKRPSGDPANPPGISWIGLDDKLSIYGTSDPQGFGRTDYPTGLQLSARDIADVYDLLSEGSQVIIRR